MTDNIILIIKAANQSVVDQKLECNLNCTVQYIKEEISKTHPSKPSADEQRLIYSGQLLQDHITLKSILRHPSDDNSYIIHLVCSTPRQVTEKVTSSSNNTKKVSSPAQPTPINNASNNATEAAESSVPDGVRQRFASSNTNTASENSPISVQQPAFDPSRVYSLSQFPPTMQGIGDPVQQIAAMQHMYAQYMASYMQYVQAGSADSFQTQQDMMQALTTNSTVTTNITETTAQQTSNTPPVIVNQEPVQNNAQPERPNNALRGNEPGAARPAAEDEEDGAPRDWLDYLYFASRMVILLCVVYFYSTVTRFVIVIISCIGMYMYQLGWFNQAARRDREPLVAPAPEPDAPGGGEDVGNADPPAGGGAPSERIAEGGSGGGGGEEGETSSSDNPIREPPQPSILALSWTFLTTFFTSLIPDQHQIV